MAILVKVPLDDGDYVVVEADRSDVKGGTTLAATPGQTVAQASRTLAASLDDLQPMLRTIKQKLAAAGPDEFNVQFGVKLGGETGIIIAKGSAEVNLTISMSWRGQPAPAADGTS
ncbi:MAG: hypothetical protein JWN95_2039 [Frankiales bacterium]|nr:hypothetical protein [Frankiales bacterium]